MKLTIPQDEEPTQTTHVDDNGRIKQAPPLQLPEAEDLEIPKDIEEKFPLLPPAQKQRMAMRQIYTQVKDAKTMDDVEKLEGMTKHIPTRDRPKFVKKLDDIKLGIHNRTQLKRTLQLRRLSAMSKGGRI